MTGNLTALANLGQAVPAAAAALDKVDFDATVDVIVEGLGVPPRSSATRTSWPRSASSARAAAGAGAAGSAGPADADHGCRDCDAALGQGRLIH